MRVALAVPNLSTDLDANLARVRHYVEAAGDAGAALVLFPEATLTGLTNDDVPAHDLSLGAAIPGPRTEALAALARATGVWLELGLLEREGSCLYDSAILLAPDGRIALHYRRMQPQWHGRAADPAVYREGSRVAWADTPFGRVACLICGDLFDDATLGQATSAAPDLLLFPFARCFSDGSHDQARWDAEELPIYAARLASMGAYSLLANSLSPREMMGGSFGGAWVLDRAGSVLAAWPLGREGMLLADLPDLRPNTQ